MNEFEPFIRVQIDNLRSNNSRNALTLVYELFQDNRKKMSENYQEFTQYCMPAVLVKTQADKSFIASVAKKAIMAAV